MGVVGGDGGAVHIYPLSSVMSFLPEVESGRTRTDAESAKLYSLLFSKLWAVPVGWMPLLLIFSDIQPAVTVAVDKILHPHACQLSRAHCADSECDPEDDGRQSDTKIEKAFILQG